MKGSGCSCLIWNAVHSPRRHVLRPTPVTCRPVQWEYLRKHSAEKGHFSRHALTTSSTLLPVILWSIFSLAQYRGIPRSVGKGSGCYRLKRNAVHSTGRHIPPSNARYMSANRTGTFKRILRLQLNCTVSFGGLVRIRTPAARACPATQQSLFFHATTG